MNQRPPTASDSRPLERDSAAAGQPRPASGSPLGASNCEALRWLGLLLAAMPISLLLIAGQLSADPSGLGTHQQLGLPPCTFRVLFGIPCPACGMTTSWAYFAQGRWPESAATNPGGFLLAIYGLAVSVAGLVTAWRRCLPRHTTLQWFAVGLIAVGLITVGDWAYRTWPILPAASKNAYEPGNPVLLAGTFLLSTDIGTAISVKIHPERTHCHAATPASLDPSTFPGQPHAVGERGDRYGWLRGRGSQYRPHRRC